MPSARLTPAPTDPLLSFPPRSPRGERIPETDDAYLLRLCLDLKLDALLLALGAAASDPAADPACTSIVPSGTEPPPPLAAGPDLAADASPDPTADTSPAPAAGVGPDLTADAATAPDRDPAPDPDASPDPDPGHDPGPGAAPDLDQEAASDPWSLPWERWLREDVETTQALARELVTWGGSLPSSMGKTDDAVDTAAVLDRLDAFHVQLRALLAEVEALRGGQALPLAAAASTSASSARVQAVVRHCRRRLTELESLRVELSEALVAQQAAADTSGCHPGQFLG